MLGFSPPISDCDTLFTMALSLAVRKGLSVVSAEMCVVTPILSVGGVVGVLMLSSMRACASARERFLRDRIIVKAMMAMIIDSAPTTDVNYGVYL